MKITDNKVVSLSYQLKVDGEVVDQASAEYPLEFICGVGMLLPKFEQNLMDKQMGDKFEFKLTPEEGYGAVTDAALVDIPLSTFMVDGELEEDLLVVGNVIPMQNQQGQRMDGRVVELKAETVVLDFNHPMAGKDLYFTGEVLGVREASEEELSQGLHGSAGGCGCGSGGCGSEGCGDGSCGDGGCGTDDEEGGCGSGCGCH